ncbi:hypothetical protein [Amycolatopsis panacis]|uniref:HipA-like C-terminal domain-containing protein n=1 Tax=Amycolatopsis panacis TaxID=2340917 RepID=A0A419I943_9PSEU|nr:hypothetical protein [Amycolatopsis panacis]RJQ88581.1 hypothetical protein D5S19_06435 [Amycolatopsis panacis]
MTDEYQVVDVSKWPVASIEPRGDEPKTWLEEPDSHQEPRRWLFKPITRHEWGDQGEDWSEKISAEVGRLLAVPCARVELAMHKGERGLISLDLAPRPLQLFAGMLLMPGVVPGYQVGAARVDGRPGHSLSNIRLALAGCAPPPASALPPTFHAFDVFVGYLLLDALIANRDRHDENWAILRPADPVQPDMLCGAYDHASSLGYNLRDADREQKLRGGRVVHWVKRGTAWRFEHSTPPGPVTLVALAAEGLRMAGPATRGYWMDRLHNVDTNLLVNVVSRIPGMSDPARTFAMEVLRLNRERLLNEC